MKTPTGGLFLRIVAVVFISFAATGIVRAGGKVAAWGLSDVGQTRLPRDATNIVRIATGGFHNLALKADGTVVSWGLNHYGQTNVPSGLTDVTNIGTGYEYSMAIKADGTVIAWGANYCGQTTVPPGLSNVVAVTGGYFHTMALKADGTVVVWYDNSSGQVGGVNFASFNVPPGLSKVTAIAASELNSIALRADGTVAVWGDNTYGQTAVPPGLSNVIAVATGERYCLALKADGTVQGWGWNAMGQTVVPPGLSNVTAIAAGSFHNLALKSDNTIVSWGYNAYGETNVPVGLTNATAIAAGADHSLAIVAYGPPEILQEPGNLELPYASNVVFAVTADGQQPLSFQWRRNGSPLTDSARIFGINTASLTISNAQFSDTGSYTVIVSNAFGWVQSTGAVITVFSPPILTLQPAGRSVLAGTNITLTAAAIGTTPLSYQWMREGIPLVGATKTSLSLSNVQSIQSGNYSLRVTNIYGPMDSSNALVTVLDSAPYFLTQPTNRAGFLGGTVSFTLGARGSTPLSYQWRFNGTNIPGATGTTLSFSSLRNDQAGFYTVAVSNAFGVVISAKAELSVSQVAVWGGSASMTNVPPGLTNLIAISAGEDHLLALKADGTVAAWGSASRFWPVSPNPLTNVPSGLNGVTAIAAGLSHNLAVRSNGTVVAWGDGSYGQTNIPAGLSNVIGVAVGDLHSLALKADGRVVAWGARGPFLGHYSYTTLTNVPPGLSNVVAIAAGLDRSLALKNDGRIVAWGLSGATNVPASLSNVIAIACGEAVTSVRPAPGVSTTFNLALKADGTVVSWSAGTQAQPPYPWIVPSVPPSGLSNVVSIAARGHGMALKTDGSVVLWGLTNPPPPQGLSNAISIAAGYGFAVAVAGGGSPRFTIQPASQTVTNGAKVQFHARAVGVQPLNYQWQLNGVNLPGATKADLTITNALGRDTGSYRVLVTNALGAVTGSPATLSIPFSTNLAAALNTTNLVWTSGTPGWPWFAQIQETHDGNVAAQSGRITNGQQSVLQTTVTGPGTLMFWWKVSSEEGYDRLWFNVDVMSSIRSISGETDWQPVTMPIPSGSHVVRWVYSKDATVSAGRDAGWLDEVLFTPATPLMLTAPRLLPDGSMVFEAGDSTGRILLPENLALVEVQASTNLRDWITLTGVCTLTNGALLLRDPDCGNHPSRFYRVIER